MAMTGKNGWVDAGLLLIRIGVGVMFILFGWGKITGGPEKWQQLGGAMGSLGVTFWPGFWGFCAAMAEFGGGILLIAGLLFRPAAGLMAFTMIVAVTMLVRSGAPMMKWSHAADMAIVFTGLVLTGPGRWSVKAMVPWLSRHWFG